MTNPKKSQSLHVENLNDELSVYDWQRQQMHSLNPTAASVFELCDGKTSPEKMAVKLDAPKELVWQSLAELDKAKLLEVEAEKAFWQKDISRRQFLKVGSAVAAAAIVSIMLPSPAAAQSAPAVPTATAIPPAANIVMYSAGHTDGAIGTGGRAGADAMCINANATGLPNAHAFISVNVNDEIRDMPGNYTVPTALPVVGPTGTAIANNWTELLNPAIALTNSLRAASVTGEYEWWIGSNSSGAVQAETCLGFTNNTGANQGGGGDANTTAASWLDNGAKSCDQGAGALTFDLICIAY